MSSPAVTRLSISDSAAQQVIESAIREAQRLGVAAVVAVVDESGVLKAFHRMDGSLLSMVQVAQDKAFSSAATRLPTGMWFEATRQDKVFEFGISAIKGICPLAGGVPISLDGQVIGAVGVSAGTLEQDEQIAQTAAAAVGSAQPA
ncbi:GlcG/HbpS family heme-binding protein [Arthrobacter ramosus]|uniref:Heme-binding protein n=1 Tax=Arthrobacter ramosus TaxID=1672 RepID=A0ABV5Y4P9_ARTRM|nr:heme-binding protein [Arthrobacter ramosus]